MQTELTLGLAFLAGLGGAGHCWAMCGGLAGGLFYGCGASAGVQRHAAYHLGRILAYSALGVLAAGLGQAVVLTGGVGLTQGGLYLLAGLAVTTVGAWRLLGTALPAAVRIPHCARAGTQSSGAAGKALPFLLAGFTNGLMPCALVYSLAVKAMTAPTLLQGAGWLASFGLGTVPAMAVVGALARGLSVQPIKWLHVLSACALIILGLQTVSGGAEFVRVMRHL